MKYVFLALLGCLLLASALTALRLPGSAGTRPVIYWLTDLNPAREQQVRLFEEWMRKNGHPPVDLRLDAANPDVTKAAIQGVSGVGSDILDTQNGSDMQYFHAIGIAADLTGVAKTMDFDPSRTYPSILPEITLTEPDGQLHQFRFPCNVTTALFWVNRQTFAKYGQPPPPARWTVEDFESRGKAFVAAANTHAAATRIFFADKIPLPQLRRSFGISEFNETMTRSELDDPRYVTVLKTLKRWTDVDRLVPSEADKASFSADSGYAGQAPQLFNNGSYALFWSGRFMLIQYRQFDDDRRIHGKPPLDLTATEPPYFELPNTSIFSRGASVYAGSKHKDLAYYFLQFLASPEYNEQVVDVADSLPPDPQYTRVPEYLHPPKYPGEAEPNRLFADAAGTIAVGNSYSPFVLFELVQREDDSARDKFLNGILSAEDAAKVVARRINEEIDRTLRDDPSRRPSYDHLLAQQHSIEQYRRENRKVPADWITNPFLKKYYQFKGWSE